MKNQIKELRVKIDGLAQLTKRLEVLLGYNFNESAVYGNTKEIKKSVENLYLSKAWLGKMLGELGTENPYGSGYKTKEDIVPTQDVNISIQEVFNNSMLNRNHIEKVDWLRQEIQAVIKDVSKWYTHTQAPSREFSIARTNTYNYLCEARFWLGFELERIKENEDND